MPRESKRHKILEAAALIVHNQGTDALTLDAVAKQAEVSKGGLLYHFSSKESLVKGLVEHMDTIYRENVEGYANADQEQTGKWTRALVNTMYKAGIENKEISAGMLAAQGINPQLLKPLQETYSNWQEQIQQDEGIDEVQATILRLAVDGLWLSEIFGLGTLDDDLRKKVLERLLQHTHNHSSE
ncbi:TetR/AcrR family transcriptional regulator [Pontibacillus yanchengensis]|uniref:TetR family transcriptional regulator n=1 Tax=Pontibacillus yanchengensis Y32 TaxID=1385514 RepID=A0A0A2TQ38_9BACI|nr:TetR/AcrR family transcriptional regulator [Pontibacillus yanchengensis]KGP71400.1 TetR family transcriptional regulator [Pontibacillus yanchengensis Y32]